MQQSPKKDRKNFSNTSEFEQPPHPKTFLAIFGAGDRNDIDSSKIIVEID